MRKILSSILIALILNNIFLFNVFAWVQINFTTFTITINDDNAYTWDVEVFPWDKIALLLRWANEGDKILNPRYEFDFSISSFNYSNSNLVTKLNWTTVYENISLDDFNPWNINTLKVSDSAESWDFIRAYYVDLIIDEDISEDVLIIWTKILSDNFTSNSISRNVYINSRPHVNDYYFENNWSEVTQLVRWWGENIDLIVEVKDYNWCDNIDNWEVIVNLSELWLSSDEWLLFDSCSWNIAKYKKSWITTLIQPWSISLVYSDFWVIDESWNANTPDDTSTTFSNEDYKVTLNLEIVSAWSPELSLNIDDEYIWWITNNDSILEIIWNQNWDYKIINWDNLNCDNWTTLTDWTSYIANETKNYIINSSDLNEGNNNIVACLKNDEDLIGSYNKNITKDTVEPIISEISVWPANVVDEDSVANFKCSDNGSFKIEKWWNWILNSGILIWTWSVISNIPNSYTISNSDINVNDNDFYIYCLDEAENTSSNIININKTTIPPSFLNESIIFNDNDNDFDWLDGRDLTVTWSNVLWNSYDFFESYRLYIIPSNINIDLDNHSYLYLNSDKNSESFTWTELIKNDSLWNTLLTESNYKTCITIMWSNWLLWEAWCSDMTTLVWDDVIHSAVISAKFTSDITLELTTDTTLDTNKTSHKAEFISYNIDWNNFIWESIESIDWNKITINIPVIWASSIIWSNLVILTWSIRSEVWGYNDLQNFSEITDGQVPLIYNFANNTNSIYNNYFSDVLHVSYAFSEDMKNTDTRVVITRSSWNLDSNEYIEYILDDNLLSWIHSQDIDLKILWLVDWTNYQLLLEWKDVAWNYNKSLVISDITFDSIWPDKIIQDTVDLYSTLTPELTWNIPLDNNWNWSGIKEYKINIYDWVTCSWTLNQSSIVINNTKIIDSVWNIANYSWNVIAFDNIWNEWIISDCDTFRVDTSVPVYSNSYIQDINLSSIEYIKNGNNIEIVSTITDTDINHIWIDLSLISWDENHNNILCSDSSINWITCDYIWGIVTYNLNSWSWLIDWVKQIKFNSQNTSGWNDSEKIISIISDSNSPVIENWAITWPFWIIWWTGSIITWDTTKIKDTIWLDYLKIEYSTWSWIWNTIWTGSNVWHMDWDLINIESWNDYKIKITAYDNANNSSNLEWSIFEIDRTNPIVPDDTIAFPVWWEILWWSGVVDITWNNLWITDNILAINPISLFYSLDNWNNWLLIDENLANNWFYSWVHWNINSEELLLKITVFDSVWNFESSENPDVFIIDTTNPVINVDFSSTPVNWSYVNNSWFDIVANNSDIHDFSTYYSFLNLTDWTYFDWNSFSWTVETYNNICTDTSDLWTTWMCNIISFNLISNIINDSNYRLQLKSLDEAWNIAFSIPVDFTWDTVNPNIIVNTASWTYFKDSILITWTSSDLWSWVSSVKIQIQKWANYWDWSNFVWSIQTLNTETIDDFSSWSYDLNFSWIDWEYKITSISYDKSYKVNNISEEIIIINKDTTIPSIDWWVNLFSSPLEDDIYIWWEIINISWDNAAIYDNWSWLNNNPIKIEYFNGNDWVVISDNEENDWEYLWTSSFIDSDNVKIKLSVVDEVWNISYQNSNSFIVDSTKPTISSLETMDLDANWYIDWINVIMSENIKDSSIDLSDFFISDWIGNPTLLITGNEINDNRFVLTFPWAWDTWTTPTISYTKWNLIDIAWKFLESDSNISSIDKSAPRLLETEIYDNDWNWKFDNIMITFSEDLLNTSDDSVFSINNVFDWITVDWVNITGDIANISLNEWVDFDTSVWLMKINLFSNSNWRDYNNNTVWSISDWSISDRAKPVAYKAEYFDIDWNYKVDKVEISFSENIYNFSENDFTISWIIKNSWSVNNNVVNFDIVETPLDNDTWIIADFTFNEWSLTDLSSNLVDDLINVNIDDKVRPKLLSIETVDDNLNGRIDSILLNYSESLNSDFSTFIWEVDSYNINSYIKWNDSELFFNISEKDNFDSNEEPLIKITSNNSLSDSNNNLIGEFEFINSNDKVGPVIIWARYDEWVNKIFIHSSEELNISNYTTSSFILNNAWWYSIDSVDFSEKSITLSWENISFWLTEISFSSSTVTDLLWNKQEWEYFIKISPPIIINEIMLSDNSNNNYIELRNLSNSSVDISWYNVEWVTVYNWTSIDANWYYLIAKANNDNSILNIIPNLVDWNLDISWTNVVLNNWVMDIDFASLTTGLFDTNNPKSIERKENIWDWLLTSSWYTAQASIWFDDNVPLWTPGIQNIYDTISPIITWYSPDDNVLLPIWSLNINFAYSDNIWWLWINTNSDDLSLVKWDWSNWSTNIASTYVDFSSKLITSTNSNYKVNSLEYWKYKIYFSISDKAGNIVTQSIIFYIDDFSFDINTNSVDIWVLTSSFNVFSEQEIIFTVKTVWAWFNIDLLKNWLLTNNWTDIIDFDWNFWFWLNQYNSWYSWIISSIWSNINISNEAKNINLDGERNTFIYKIKFGAKIDVTQWAWIYTVSPEVKVLTNY